MSTNGQPQPGPPQQGVMQISCSNCQKEMVVPQPSLRVFNSPDISILAFSHTRVHSCPGCGTKYLCMLGGVDQDGHILFMWTPVQTKESAILAPTNENMKNAISTNTLANQIKKVN